MTVPAFCVIFCAMSQSIERVKKALLEHGIHTEIGLYPQGTRTAADAAAAIGVPLGSIVKSLLFTVAGQPLLVLVAGDQRADPAKIARLLQVPPSDIALADAETVRQVTGFAIGGVPPLGHSTSIPTLIDATLARFDVVHAAAGTPYANFPIAFTQLVEVTHGQLADIVAEAHEQE